jgi:hypothetical protein
MAEEAMRGHLLDPTSREKDAISAASIMMRAVATTQSWKLWDGSSKHIPSLRDLHAMEDANYALRHFKASYKGASPYKVLEDDLDCLRGLPRSFLRSAQELTEMGGELVDDLRLVAGKQFDQVEQNTKSTRAKVFVQNVGIPLAQRLFSSKTLLKHACSSKPLAEQLSGELESLTVMEAKQIETHLPKIKCDLKKTLTTNLLFETEEPISTRQISLFRELEKRYANVISRVERLPDQESKEAILATCEVERASWATLVAKSKRDDWILKYRTKK